MHFIISVLLNINKYGYYRRILFKYGYCSKTSRENCISSARTGTLLKVLAKALYSVSITVSYTKQILDKH